MVSTEAGWFPWKHHIHPPAQNGAEGHWARGATAAGPDSSSALMPWDPNAREAVLGARGSYPGNQAVPETGRSREKQLPHLTSPLQGPLCGFCLPHAHSPSFKQQLSSLAVSTLKPSMWPRSPCPLTARGKQKPRLPLAPSTPWCSEWFRDGQVTQGHTRGPRFRLIWWDEGLSGHSSAPGGSQRR